MAPLALLPALRNVPFILDLVDVDSAKWSSLATRTAPPRRWLYAREACLLSRFERRITQRAFTTTVVTPRELHTLRAIAPTAKALVVPNGVDAAHLTPTGQPRQELLAVFCGVMNYPPNVEGAIWVARDVWPLVRRDFPSAKLQIVGSNPTRAVRKLARLPGIDVVGPVRDVRPYLWKAAIALAPLLHARGVQNKVLEAVAAGLPTVVTPPVLSGLPADILPACLCARQPAEFAAAIAELLRLSPTERRQRAQAANLETVSWEHSLESLIRLVRDAAASNAPESIA